MLNAFNFVLAPLPEALVGGEPCAHMFLTEGNEI